MSREDVSGDEMTPDELTDAQLAALFEGTLDEATAGHPVAEFLDATRRTLDAVEVPVPRAELAEFVGVDPSIQPIEWAAVPSKTATPTTVVTLDAAAPPRRRKTMIPALAAFAGTSIGKVALSGSIALAATAGAHATGIVDVPGLPDPQTSLVDSIDDGSFDDESSTTSTTVSSVASPTTASGANVGDDSSDGSTPSSTLGVSSSTSTTSTTTVPTSTSGVPASGDIVSIAVAGLGTVDVRLADRPVLVTSSASNGWSVRADDSDEVGEIDLIFSNGTNRIDFSFEYEDGLGRARIRDRATDVETVLWYSLADGSLVERIDDSDDDPDDDDDDDADDFDDLDDDDEDDRDDDDSDDDSDDDDSDSDDDE